MAISRPALDNSPTIKTGISTGELGKLSKPLSQKKND
jgi:hypothetical protein